MALLNPVYGLVVPFLFLVTIPLAILAGITTTIAFSVLMFRVALVYLDIAVNLVPQYIAGRPVYPLFRGYANPATVSAAPAAADLPAPGLPLGGGTSGGHGSPATSRQVAVARHHRRRRTSGASFNSIGGSVTPTDDNDGHGNGLHGGSKRGSFTTTMMMTSSSVGIDRDFEGVGGWRLSGKTADDDDDAWTHINSRLSLPLDHHWRHHHRSPSGAGTATPGGNGGAEYLMMRSPSGVALGSEERMAEHANRKGREREDKDGASSKGSGGRTPTRVLPPWTTTVDDASYFPRVVSPRAERRSVGELYNSLEDAEPRHSNRLLCGLREQ